MTAHPLEIDHVFLFIEPDGPEVDALQCLGFVETYRRAHPGQGTANVCFAFDNLYLELLWLTSETEARSPAIERTRLWERGQWRKLGTCPFGIALRGDLASTGVPTWDYRPPYLPAGMSIPVGTDSDDPMQPMLFVSPGREAPLDWPEAGRGALQSAAGFGPVLSVDLALPGGAASTPLRTLKASGAGLGCAARADGRFGLRLLLGDRSGQANHVLAFVSTNEGPWQVSLTEEPLAERSWRRAWAALGVPAPQGVMTQLLDAYAEPQRHYHSPQHLRECLTLLESALALAQRPGEVELALWFHDAVHDPKGKDNEQRSADWACEVLSVAGAKVELQQRVRALIMATCHNAVPVDSDAQLLVDIDLAILGSDPARFAEYDQQVRAEYRWVPGWIYRRKRKEVLAAFLQRPAIYSTERFRNRFDAQARENLGRAIGTLAGAVAHPLDPF